VPGSRRELGVAQIRAAAAEGATGQLVQGLTGAAATAPVPPSRPEEAGPAADLLFDVFAFAFSPGGFAVVGLLVGLGCAPNATAPLRDRARCHASWVGTRGPQPR
jgi:hypothetical protein